MVHTRRSKPQRSAVARKAPQRLIQVVSPVKAEQEKPVEGEAKAKTKTSVTAARNVVGFRPELAKRAIRQKPCFAAQIGVQRGRQGDGAICLLPVFKHCDQTAPNRKARAVEGMHKFRLAAA